MEKQLVFHILGIEETKDEQAIKAAYMTKLRKTNPEDDPEGFKRLREAYEEAVAFSRLPEEGEEKEKTEIDLWIDRADEVYRDIGDRCDPEAWEEILSDPLCEDLDTSLEAREAFLAYLMDHVNLPQAIWKLIDGKFQIRADRELLEQKFPRDFMNYIVYYMENPEFIDYSLFCILDRQNMDADGYIRNYLNVKRQIDSGEYEGCEEKLAALKAFGLYHPYQDAERLRIFAAEERTGEAEALCEELLSVYDESSYVLLQCGEALWAAGRKEEANGLWEKILSSAPSHYMALTGRIRYLLYKEEYENAKEIMIELLNANGNDETILGYMKEANQALIEAYKEKLSSPCEDEKKRGEDTVELGWCLFQNEREEEAVALLEGFSPDKEQEYSYVNLFGRILYRIEQYDRALPYLKRWLDMILDTPDDGTKENTKRISREFQARYIISGCYHGMKDEEQALAWVDTAIQSAKEWDDRMSSSQYKAQLLFSAKEYERCIDVCDELISRDDRYFPAYVQRQEAAFELRKGQQVVDDYYNAIGIYAGYYKPYMLAAQVFFFYDQFDDAKGVIDRARENQVEFSPNLKLYDAKILRNLAEGREDREKIFPILTGLLGEAENPDTDIEDLSEIEFEISLLHWDNNEYEQALKHLETAIEQNPDRKQYRLICGHIYLDMKKYNQALGQYHLAAEDYENSPSLHYNRGLCHEAMNEVMLAKKEFERTLECKEGYRDACEKLADYYKKRYTEHFAREDFDKSLEYFNRQLAVRENCYYLVERGRLYMTDFQFEPAIRDFKKALEYVETDWASYNNMGCCYKYMAQFDKAIECFEKAVVCMENGSKSVLPYSNMADCYEALKDYRKAVWCYEKVLEMFPDRNSFRVEIGLLYTYLGEYEKALEYFNQVPDDDDYYDNVSDVYFLQGKKKEAVTLLGKGIGNAKSRERKSNAYQTLANYYKDYERNFKKAEYALKKALGIETREKELHEIEWQLAELCFRTGREKDAKLHAEKALEHFEKSKWATEEDYLNYGEFRPARLMRHGWIYIALGEIKKGLGMLEDMNKCTRCRQCRHPGCYESYLYQGWYYEATGNYEKALECYRKGLEINEHSIKLRISMEALEKSMKS